MSSNPLLNIKNLSVKIAGKQILKDISFRLIPGKINVLMGPNGSGKSSLAQSLMGLPDWQVTSGRITYLGQNITRLPLDQRSRLGIFLAWQNPPEIPGLNVKSFLMTIFNSSGQGKLKIFEEKLQRAVKLLKLPENFLNRELNAGFSGGEKKKMEIIQMLILDPKLIIFDEIDSGLDLDALKNILNIIKKLQSTTKTFLLITHNPRIFKHLIPDQVIVLCQGQIVTTGKKELIKKIEKHGFSKITK